MPNKDKRQEIKIKKEEKIGPKTVSLSVPIYSLKGTEEGKLELPKEIFAGKVNKPLLAQAIRVYLNNQTGHFTNTKTRGEVAGSTRKIYRQKGTGGARHGSIKAPIFVGGGIALGPRSRRIALDLPLKMKQAALISALSGKLLDKEVIGVSGLDKAFGKTSEMQKWLDKLGKKSILLVVDKSAKEISRAVRNIQLIKLTEASQINALEVLNYQTMVLTKEAVANLQTRLGKKAEGEVS